MLLEIKKSIRIFIIISILLGILYPVCITIIGQLTMSDKANGSLIIHDNKIVGSKLIAQAFNHPRYFYSRPSAVNYNAAGSGGSNLGPSSKKLLEEVEKRINVIRRENNLELTQKLPADMVLESASGLDPHISWPNALLQVSRIASIRNIPEIEIQKLIKENIDANFIGIWGQQGINVLKLNLALDTYKTSVLDKTK